MLFILDNIFLIVYYILLGILGDKASPLNHELISYFEATAITISNVTFFLGHWIFAWKYWPAASNLANLKSGNLCSYILLYSMSLVIIVDCVIYGIIDGRKKRYGPRNPPKDLALAVMNIANYTMQIFLFADFLIVLLSLIRIKRALKAFPHIQINKGMILLHSVMLFSMCLSGGLQLFYSSSLFVDMTYAFCVFLANIFIAFIMYKTKERAALQRKQSMISDESKFMAPPLEPASDELDSEISMSRDSIDKLGEKSFQPLYSS